MRSSFARSDFLCSHRITIAHPEANDSFSTMGSYPPSRRKSRVDSAVTDEQLGQLLAGTAHPLSEDGNVEDLTGEMQEMMMR